MPKIIANNDSIIIRINDELDSNSEYCLNDDDDGKKVALQIDEDINSVSISSGQIQSKN